MNLHPKTLSRFVPTLILLVLTLAWVSRSHGQTWATNSPLKAARWSHTAALLTNGSVLIAGGTIYNVSGNFADTNGCELYNPAAGTSTLTGSMQVHRHSHTATRLTNGQVLVAGGGGNATSELYAPSSGTWINLANMSDERLAHTATLLPSGKVLAAGGYNDSNGQELSSAELYDPVSGTWTSTGQMPYAADSEAAALLTNGMVLVCGGSQDGNAVTNSALYNPVSQTWTNTAPMKQARSGHTATALTNGMVLVVGGGDVTAEIYDPVAGTWTYVASMNDGRVYPQALLLNNGQVMVLGDANPHVELYDPASDTWTYTDSLPVPGHFQTATLLSGGQVVVTGGSVSDYNGPPLAVVETYGATLTTPSLTVTATPLTGPRLLSVQFTSPSVDSGGNTVTNWNWNFGDGGTSTAQSPSHTYTNVGSYSPSLTAYSTYGASPLSITGPGVITITNHTLNVTFSPQGGPAPLSVQFTSPGVDSGGNSVTNWNWDFGDGGTSTAQNPSHSYTTVGSFSPSLTARSTYGGSPLSITGLGIVTVTNTPNPNFRTLYSFTPTFGSDPTAGLVLSGNTLYGTTYGGGSGNYGTVFCLNTDGSGFTNLNSFNLSNGARPNGLILSGTTLYGTTAIGGTRGGGTVFAIKTNGLSFTNVLNLNDALDPNSGDEPMAAVVLAGNTLYGTTWFGGFYNKGTVFTVTTNGTNSTILHSFITPNGNNANADGILPSARLIISGSTLYGTALNGGSLGRGTVFAVETNAPGSFRVLHNFTLPDQSNGTNSDGSNPWAGLVLSGNILYGTTFAGGSSGYGTVFAVNTNGSGFTNLYSFTGGNGAYGPHAGLALSGNTLYGTTSGGGLLGTLSNGTLFALNTDGSGYRNLYSFTGGSDGSGPVGDLIVSGNILYGTAAHGGSGDGTVFSFTLSGPRLTITPAGTNVILTWSTSASGYALQSNIQLGAGAVWSSVSPLPVVVNGLNTVTNPISGSQKFYRLSQ